MSSRFDRRPSQGSGSSSGSRGRRPFRDGPPLRRDRDEPWGGRFETGSSERRLTDRRSSEEQPSGRRSTDRRPSDKRSSDRRFSERRPGDFSSNDRRPSFERRSSDRSQSDRRFSDRRPRDSNDRRPTFERGTSEGRSYEGRSSEDRFSENRFSERRPRDQNSKTPRPSFDRRPSPRPSGDRRPRFEERRPQSPVNSKRSSPRLEDKPRGESSPHAAERIADDLLWGRHATQAALEAGRPIHRIWCTSELRSASKFLQLLKDAKSSGVLVEEVTWARLGQLTGGAVHQGIVLQTAAAETFDLQDLVNGCSALEEAPLLLALDGLTDPQNLGAIVRSAEALGAHGVVLPQRRSAGLTGSVAKVAAGALEHLPVARVVNLNRSLETLKSAGYRVIGLAEEGDLTLEEVDLDGPLVIVTGSEGQGLSMLTRRHCDQLIRIPLRGVTPSLNASVATALCVYEVARRGWMKGLKGQNPSPRITRPQLAGSSATKVPITSDPVEEIVLDQTSDTSMVTLDLQRDSAPMSGTDAFGVSIDL
ncbi:MAG: 23S rRNA (guanosine(2251)-2'-O)-methyltransferase RlmB [Synechococcus sp. NP17]|nr:23S rRNA (guanosine(2251)-2'-O)-methyltransferase RlmB [Synechococcus sp. NP17]